MPRFEEQNNPFSSWLYAIARNTTIDYWKKKKDILLDDADAFNKIKSKESDPIHLVEKKEKAQIIHQAIGILSPSQQEVIILKFIEDLSNQEIAQLTEKTEEAVRQLQCRALKILRQHLKEAKII